MKRKIINCIAAGIIAGAITVGGVTGLAAPASAAALPVVYTDGMGPLWGAHAVRPAEIVGGARWGFAGPGNMNKPGQLRPIHWTHWTVRSAYGSGQFFAANDPPPVNVDYPADIALTDVQLHGHTAYFRDATITARGHKTVHLFYNGEWHSTS
jgi:hypothetical protein